MDHLGNLQQLFQLGQQMQSRLSDLNDRLEKETLSATSGGGMVEVSADGRGNVRRVKLDPAVVDPSDIEMLEDLILAAVSEVQRRARETMEKEMKNAAGGLPLSSLAGLLGG
ncbi:MAG: YbaB/EbfC family nucleoid-associated protein [Gemmatimonadetes bacterium]|nr:YbaB/EbfC family nucleoid-associated protein [Gemmatimonadota bacterium]MCZ6824706.1 YbaB/EbfC family nucleoid-associated protein [Gemmatimonadota bacterium]